MAMVLYHAAVMVPSPRTVITGPRCHRLLSVTVALVLVAAGGWTWVPGTAVLRSQQDLHDPLDDVLDQYVRDGFVYYLALKNDRARIDRYVASLDVSGAVLGGWSRERRVAFWLNAYNALVLQTVLERYPIRGQSPNYPPNSIRQIPGAFESRRHQVGGRAVTLDEIEGTILTEFEDPRVYLALGRGAVGSGRLLSEAYRAARLDTQLGRIAGEFATTPRYVSLDRLTTQVVVSPILGWRADEFIEAFAASGSAFAERSPLERALFAFIERHLFQSEREFLRRNDCQLAYREFDWRLNDLTGGRP